MRSSEVSLRSCRRTSTLTNDLPSGAEEPEGGARGLRVLEHPVDDESEQLLGRPIFDQLAREEIERLELGEIAAGVGCAAGCSISFTGIEMVMLGEVSATASMRSVLCSAVSKTISVSPRRMRSPVRSG